MKALYPWLMWLCLFLFVCRVLGQIYVGLYKPHWLPSWKEWYSGLLPYPWLLLSQVLIIMWMTMIAYDYSRGEGWFLLENPEKAVVFKWLAIVYFSGMVIRYALTVVLKPERRWFKGTIPIWFHMVLAVFIFLAATYSFH